MKIIQLLGTRNKVDFVLYLARTLADQNKRVLVVDATKHCYYQWGIADFEKDDFIFEIDSVEVLRPSSSWKDVISFLKDENETPENYDVVLIDMDTIDVMLGDWPKFSHTLYVGDNDRYNFRNDIPLVHRYLDEHPNQLLRRVHFESMYPIKTGYMELLLNNRIAFTEDSFVMEYDELQQRLYHMMQHDLMIPVKKLSKSYKEVLNTLTMEWLGLDTYSLVSTSRFSIFNFKKKKRESDETGIIGG